jgi:hypothetical protein
MSVEQFIYSHEYVSARIYGYLKFKKYVRNIAEIVCAELQYDQEILDVNISHDGKTVWVNFKDSDFGFDAALLWDKNIRNTVQSYSKYDSDTK